MLCEYPLSVAADANDKPNQSAMKTIEILVTRYCPHHREIVKDRHEIIDDGENITRRSQVVGNTYRETLAPSGQIDEALAKAKRSKWLYSNGGSSYTAGDGAIQNVELA